MTSLRVQWICGTFFSRNGNINNSTHTMTAAIEASIISLSSDVVAEPDGSAPG